MDRKEFFTKAPLNLVPYTTIETYHPDDGLHRYVAGQQFNKQFIIEANAPRNPVETVEFEAASLQSDEVEQGEEGEVSLDIQLGAIGQMIKERMKKVDLWFPIEVIRRTYIGENNPPQTVISLESDQVGLDDVLALITASQVNQYEFDVSRKYTPEIFPGLEQQI